MPLATGAVTTADKSGTYGEVVPEFLESARCCG